MTDSPLPGRWATSVRGATQTYPQPPTCSARCILPAGHAGDVHLPPEALLVRPPGLGPLFPPPWPYPFDECGHGSATGVDATEGRDPAKVWACDGCDRRFVTVPAPDLGPGISRDVWLPPGYLGVGWGADVEMWAAQTLARLGAVTPRS